VITSAVNVYRFDFPDIATYTGFATGESLTNIIREEDAKSEVVSVVGSPTEMEGGLSVDNITTTGNVDVGGTLSVSGSLSNLNQPCFKVIRTNTTLSCATGENLKFNEAVIDNRNAYNSTYFEYTIPVSGDWYFSYSFASDNSELKVQLQQNTILRDEITNGTISYPIKYSLGCEGMVIIPCSVSDVIRVRVENGSVALN